MFSKLSHKIAEAPGKSLFVAATMVAVAGLLAAFYLVCNAQVRRAEIREAALTMQRVAVASCLESTPRVSVSACAAHFARAATEPPFVAAGDLVRVGTLGDGRTVRSSTNPLVPVNFTLR